MGLHGRSLTERFWEFVNKTPTCWLWRSPVLPGGYGRIKIKGNNVLAHRAAWELVNGPIPPGLWVLHKCDVRACVNPEHLFLGTRTDNVRDMFAKGRGTLGEDRPLAKLKNKDIPILRERMKTETTASLAREYGVCTATLYQVRERISHKWIP